MAYYTGVSGELGSQVLYPSPLLGYGVLLCLCLSQEDLVLKASSAAHWLSLANPQLSLL